MPAAAVTAALGIALLLLSRPPTSPEWLIIVGTWVAAAAEVGILLDARRTPSEARVVVGEVELQIDPPRGKPVIVRWDDPDLVIKVAASRPAGEGPAPATAPALVILLPKKEYRTTVANAYSLLATAESRGLKLQTFDPPADRKGADELATITVVGRAPDILSWEEAWEVGREPLPVPVDDTPDPLWGPPGAASPSDGTETGHAGVVPADAGVPSVDPPAMPQSRSAGRRPERLPTLSRFLTHPPPAERPAPNPRPWARQVEAVPSAPASPAGPPPPAPPPVGAPKLLNPAGPSGAPTTDSHRAAPPPAAAPSPRTATAAVARPPPVTPPAPAATKPRRAAALPPAAVPPTVPAKRPAKPPAARAPPSGPSAATATLPTKTRGARPPRARPGPAPAPSAPAPPEELMVPDGEDYGTAWVPPP